MVKDGYKQTDVGMIPEDWEVKEIGDICHIFGRIGFRGYTVNDIVREDKGVITISPSNIVNNTTSFDKCTYISLFKYEESPEIKIFNGDILLVKTGSTVGKTAIVNNLKREATINPQIVVLKKITVENFYLGYLVGYKDFRNNITRTVVGGAIPTLSQKQIASYKMPIPPRKEQKAIAKTLSDTDELITSLEKLISKKEVIKQGTIQQLLTGKKRLSGFSGEWEEIKIGNDTALKARIGWQGLTTNEYKDSGDYYLVTGTDFENGLVNWDTCYFVDKWRFDQDKNIQIKVNDVLITKDGTIGKAGFVETLELPATLNSGVFVIRPTSNNLDQKYLYYIFTSEIFDDFLNKLTAGSTINHLYQKDFIHFTFNAPKIEEQKEISQILSDIDNEIESLKAKLSKTKAIKDGMMSELLTGKIRLKV